MASTSQPQILFISGASGGGKSALIRQLRDGTLNPDIAQHLPVGAATWEIIEANDFMKNDLDLASLTERLKSGTPFIVHYDIAFIHCRNLTDYNADPAMQWMAQARSVQSLWIRPDAAVLQKQFSQRSHALLQKKSLGSRLWSSIVRKPKRQLTAWLKGQKKYSTADLYQQAGWIDNCYQRWQNHLQTMLAAHPHYTHLIIAPSPHSSTGESFALISP